MKWSTTDVAKYLGVTSSTVKRWADAGLLESQRTAGGHRRFERAAVNAFVARHGGGERRGDDAEERWLTLLISGADPFALQGELLLERSRVGSFRAVSDLVGGALRALGEAWEQGDVTLLEEHGASERLSRALAALCMSLPVRLGAPRCFLATAPGDEHALGLRLAELCLREASVEVVWGGAFTPLDAILGYADDPGIRLVGLSASAFSSEPDGLAHAASMVAESCERTGKGLLLGGSGAWPEPPAHGRRVHTFDDLPLALDALLGANTGVAAAVSRVAAER